MTPYDNATFPTVGHVTQMKKKKMRFENYCYYWTRRTMVIVSYYCCYC